VTADPEKMLTIREIAPSDKEQWLALWKAYNEFYGRSGATALSDGVTEATWSRFFDASEPVRAVVACLGDEIVGLAHYLFHPSTTSIAPVCYLQDLFTSRDHRGRGIGTRLIEKVRDVARLEGASRLYWQTHHANHAARSVYDKVAEDSGFVVYRIGL
jgi:GNAT superfamily N-acetyltransferase